MLDRDYAARFIEIGRTIERAHVLVEVHGRLHDAIVAGKVGALEAMLAGDVELARMNAAQAQVVWHQLIAQLSPGAALAHRVLSTVRAARAAWRAADVPAAQR